jgi:hypothetical protein
MILQERDQAEPVGKELVVQNRSVHLNLHKVNRNRRHLAARAKKEFNFKKTEKRERIES